MLTETLVNLKRTAVSVSQHCLFQQRNSFEREAALEQHKRKGDREKKGKETNEVMEEEVWNVGSEV